MGQNSITMFTNDSGSAGGPTAYVQDAFPDVSDTPSSNAGWSSTVSSNPMNNLYGNDDFPRYGPKTLWIKDLVLEPNRSLWVNGEPTYRIIWSEPFPSAQGYVYGNVSLKRNQNQTYVQVRTTGDGLGVGGVFARCMFLMVPNSAAAATAAVTVDGVASASPGPAIDFSSVNPAYPNTDPAYVAYVAESANEAYNIHDFRITANQAGAVFQIAGVVVYSENSTLTIDQFPGVTYNNKTRSSSTANTTLPLPSFSCSLGGRSVVWKNASGGYSLSAIGVSTILSIGQGSSGTNIINVSAGNGASFSTGYGIICASFAGASPYVGMITNISTDALTVSPTLPFGISNTIYRYFQSGQSLSMNASLNIFAFSYGFTEMTRAGATTPFFDTQQRYTVWGANYGVTLMDGYNQCTAFNGVSGFIQCEGYFSAAEIEWFGMSFAVLSGTMAVNGFPVYNHNNIGFTGTLKKSVFIEAGPGWNSFAFFPGSSHINVGIQRINLYQRNRDQSASYGILAQFDTLQAYAARAVNATLAAPGTYQRLFADQLLLKGQSLTRLVGATWPGGVAYACGLSAALSFQYYGTNFALLGGMSLGFGASVKLAIDNGADQGATSVGVPIALSQGFHSVSLSVLGGTLFISGLDFARTAGEMRNIQTFSQPSLNNPAPIKINRAPTIQQFLSGNGTYFTPYGAAFIRVKMVGGGGGGGGGGTSGGSNGGNGGDTSFGTTFLIAGGGLGGVKIAGVGGTGGIFTFTSPAYGYGLNGGDGVVGQNCGNALANDFANGGQGGSGVFGGAGMGGSEGNPGVPGKANTGGGGGGGGGNSAVDGGSGGGSGAYVDAFINAPLASYSYTVGAPGSAGGAGTSGFAGATGGIGYILVEEWYG